MKRAEFSRRVKLDAWERAGGACEQCARKLFPGDRIEYDHRIPCEQGGGNSLDNCTVLCGFCHGSKTAGDMKQIAKSRRQRAAHAGARTPKRKIPGSKGTGLRKRMDGTVERVSE